MNYKLKAYELPEITVDVDFIKQNGKKREHGQFVCPFECYAIDVKNEVGLQKGVLVFIPFGVTTVDEAIKEV